MEKPLVVIGGGIVGTAIAYELQRAGAETFLVERDIDPQGASAFSFASLSAFDETQRDVYLLKSQGMVGWRRWTHEFGEDLGVRFTGELRLAESEAAGTALRILVDRAMSRGYPVRFASRSDIERQEPSCNVQNFAVASLAPEDGQADPLRAIDVLRGAFSARGGSIIVGRAGLLVGDSGITVRVGDDQVQAGTVVVAAGAETTALLERLGWDIPMDPSPGLLAWTRPTEPFLNGTVYLYPRGETAVHLRQLADGRVVIGERAQDEVAKQPTMEHARELLQVGKDHFAPMEDLEVDHFSVEWRPMPRDHMPIMGPLPGLPAVYVATGHSGVTTAPAVAEMIADEIKNHADAERLRPFRPGRFAAHQADVYRSIEEAFSTTVDI